MLFNLLVFKKKMTQRLKSINYINFEKNTNFNECSNYKIKNIFEII